MALVDVIQFRFVATGSLAVEFQAADLGAITSASVTLTDSEDNEVTHDDLEIIDGSYDNTYAFGLLPPVPYGETYTIVATFNDSETHSQTLTLPDPTYSRTTILRQRLFELLLPLESDELEIYGAIHTPLSVGQDFKADSGVTVEIGVASMGSSQTASVGEIENTINVPLNIYAGAGHPDSPARITEAAEYIIGYLQSIDWKLTHLAIQPERASYSAGDPEFDQERRMASIRGVLSLPVPVVL